MKFYYHTVERGEDLIFYVVREDEHASQFRTFLLPDWKTVDERSPVLIRGMIKSKISDSYNVKAYDIELLPFKEFPSEQ